MSYLDKQSPHIAIRRDDGDCQDDDDDDDDKDDVDKNNGCRQRQQQ